VRPQQHLVYLFEKNYKCALGGDRVSYERQTQERRDYAPAFAEADAAKSEQIIHS